MAGHRRATGKGTRAQQRTARMAQRLADAPTIEAELNEAIDWWRAAVRDQPDRDTRVITLSRQLVNEAQAMDGGGR